MSDRLYHASATIGGIPSGGISSKPADLAQRVGQTRTDEIHERLCMLTQKTTTLRDDLCRHVDRLIGSRPESCADSANPSAAGSINAIDSALAYLEATVRDIADQADRLNGI